MTDLRVLVVEEVVGSEHSVVLRVYDSESLGICSTEEVSSEGWAVVEAAEPQVVSPDQLLRRQCPHRYFRRVSQSPHIWRFVSRWSQIFSRYQGDEVLFLRVHNRVHGFSRDSSEPK